MQLHRLDYMEGQNEPVDADLLMQWARITDEAERASVERLITLARGEVEWFTGRVIRPGTFLLSGAWAPLVALPLSPVISIDVVRAVDSNATLTLIDPSQYTALLDVAPALLRLPSGYGPGVQVVVTAGALGEPPGQGNGKPPVELVEALQQAVLDVALLHYRHRDDPEMLDRVRAYLGTVNATCGIVQV